MGRNEFSNAAFWSRREPGQLRVSVPVKSDRFRVLLNLVWIVIWAAGEVAILLFIPGRLGLPVAALLLAAFTAAGGVVLWRGLWCMGGRETFLIAGDALTARREIWGIGHSRRFGLEMIGSVTASRLRYRVIYPSWGRMFIGHGGSQIVIEAAGHTYAYGKGLEDGEARDLAEFLQAEMDSRSPTRRLAASHRVLSARSNLNR